MTIALTTEGYIVTGVGVLVLLVMLVLFVLRGNGETEASAESKLVKMSAPASLVGLVIGALLILVGTDFLRLGEPDDAQSPADGGVAAPPATAFPAPTQTIPKPHGSTTTTTAPTTTVTVLGEHIGELAETGSSNLTLTGIGISMVSGGVMLTRRRVYTGS